MPIRRRASRIPRGRLVEIGDVGQGFKDVPALGVHLVDAEGRVEVGVRCDRGPDPGSRDCILSRLAARSIGQRELVVVRVTKELLGNDVG